MPSADSTCPFVAITPEGVPAPTEDSDPLLCLKKLVNHMNTSFENANSCIRFILYVLLFYLISLCFAFYLITQQSRVIEDPTFGYCTVNVSNTFQQHSEQLDSLASKLKQFELDHVVETDSLETRFSLYQEKLQNLHDLIGDLENQFEAIRKQVEESNNGLDVNPAHSIASDLEQLENIMYEFHVGYDYDIERMERVESLWFYLDKEYRKRLIEIDVQYWQRRWDISRFGNFWSHLYITRLEGRLNDGTLDITPNTVIADKVKMAKELIDKLTAAILYSAPVFPEKHTLAPVDSVWPFEHETALESHLDDLHSYT